jgi:hypothetical protein
MFIKDLVMWRHYKVILENSDITTRPWQRLAISKNFNLLSTYVIWNILVLNIKGKVNKIAIIQEYTLDGPVLILRVWWQSRKKKQMATKTDLRS